MIQDQRFQIRCSSAFLDALDRLKDALGVSDRAEVVRVLVKRASDDLDGKPGGLIGRTQLGVKPSP